MHGEDPALLRTSWLQKLPRKDGTPGKLDNLLTFANFSSKARGTAGVDSASTGGTWDISNADRLGKSEVDLVNIFIEGAAQIIRWEQALEKGENIDAEVEKASMKTKA